MKDLQDLYISRFTSQAKVVVPKEEDQYLALATLDNLKSVIPASVNIDENPDILYIASNLFVAGMVNKNGDAVSIEVGKKMAPLFLHKFIDLDHKRTKIAGAIINHAFTQYGSNEIIEDIADYNEPFNMAYGGAIWKVLNPNLADILIDSSDPNSEIYNTISSSWEVGFFDFDIAVGSKFVHEAEIITDEKQKKELFDKYLKQGGIGRKDGEYVYRVIKWPLISMAAGLVRNPAADVKGVAVLFEEETVLNLKASDDMDDDDKGKKKEPEDEDEDELEEDEAKKKCKKNKANSESDIELAVKEINKILLGPAPQELAASKNIEKNAQNNSQNKKVSVFTKYKGKTMTLKELYNIIEENAGGEAVASAKSLIQEIKDGLEEANNQWKEKLAAEQKAKEELERLKSETDSALAEVRKELNSIKQDKELVEQKLAEVSQAEAQRALQERFSGRMESLESEYELGDADRKAIVASVRDLDDEAFAEWKENTFAVLAEAKSRARIAEAEKAAKEALAASKTELTEEEKAAAAGKVAEEALASAKSEDAPINPTAGGNKSSLKERFAAIFTEESVEMK